MSFVRLVRPCEGAAPTPILHHGRVATVDSRFRVLKAMGTIGEVLDRDVLTREPDAIAGTRVLRTYVGGRLVYQRGPD